MVYILRYSRPLYRLRAWHAYRASRAGESCAVHPPIEPDTACTSIHEIIVDQRSNCDVQRGSGVHDRLMQWRA